jgi:hypothetical protein
MTRFIYALKEIRACLEAELLTDVQQRPVVLSRDIEWSPHRSSAGFLKRLLEMRRQIGHCECRA